MIQFTVTYPKAIIGCEDEKNPFYANNYEPISIEVLDEGAGPFVQLTQYNHKFALEENEVDIVFKTIKALFASTKVSCSNNV